MKRFNSETKFASAKHMMPKQVEQRHKRFRTLSAKMQKGRVEFLVATQDTKIKRSVNIQKLQQSITTPSHLEKFKRFLIDTQDAMAIHTQTEKLETRNPSGWIKNLGGINSWSNREAEWYLAENRLLFSCLSDEECDRWVCMINWLVWMSKRF